MDIKKIDNNRQYQVELIAKVELLGQVFHPGRQLILRGDVLKTVVGQVKDAKPV